MLYLFLFSNNWIVMCYAFLTRWKEKGWWENWEVIISAAPLTGEQENQDF